VSFNIVILEKIKSLSVNCLNCPIPVLKSHIESAHKIYTSKRHADLHAPRRCDLRGADSPRFFLLHIQSAFKGSRRFTAHSICTLTAVSQGRKTTTHPISTLKTHADLHASQHCAAQTDSVFLLHIQSAFKCSRRFTAHSICTSKTQV
jgi:hypothetical protein